MNRTSTRYALSAAKTVICTTLIALLLISCGGGNSSDEGNNSLGSGQARPLGSSLGMPENTISLSTSGNSQFTAAQLTSAAGNAPDPCDPAVMGNSKEAAQRCFEKMAKDCAKRFLKSPVVMSRGGKVDEQCVEDAVKGCAECAKNPTGAACLDCANKAIASCTSYPTINPSWAEAYKSCMTSAVAGLGTAFLTVWDELYDLRTQVDNELRNAGCTQGSDAGFVCTMACARTNSCKNANDPFTGRAHTERCNMCLAQCKADPNYCLKLANM